MLFVNFQVPGERAARPLSCLPPSLDDSNSHPPPPPLWLDLPVCLRPGAPPSRAQRFVQEGSLNTPPYLQWEGRTYLGRQS